MQPHQNPQTTPAPRVSTQDAGRGLFSRAVARKNSVSADLLTKLVTPAVFVNTEVVLQDSIVQRLEEQIDRQSKERKQADDAIKAFELQFYGPNQKKPIKRTRQEEVAFLSELELRAAALPANLDEPNLYLGTILLRESPSLKSGVEKLIASATLEETDHAIENSPLLHLAKTNPELAAAIVRNTLRTMEMAGQLDYLATSGFIGKQWRVLVEIHYYRNRPRGMTGLHKDTLGQTLFVNLNYTNKERDTGPEFLLNPPLVPTHEELITRTLPMEFLSDLYAARKATPFEPIVRTRDLPPNAVVSFVDEAIHHATPLVGHRMVALTQLREFLAADDEFRDTFPLAEAAYLSSSAAGSAQRRAEFRKLLKDVKNQTEQEKWYQLMQLCAGDAPQAPAAGSPPKRDEPAGSKPENSDPERPREALLEPDPAADSKPVLVPALGNVGRPDLLMMMSDPQIDRLLATYAGDAYRKVSIPAAARADKETQAEPLLDESGHPISLTREISQRALLARPAPAVDTPRRFFRTWVRAVSNVNETDHVS